MHKKIPNSLISTLYSIMENCELCPHKCHVNRRKGQKGKCGTLDKPFISSSQLHFGEEHPLVGYGGSGTIFMTGCNLNCVYCQNYDISQEYSGRYITIQELAQEMLFLQKKEAHNINFVTPTHQIPMIVDALSLAYEKGLTLPVVYNCGGYENPAVIKLLDGIIDIYMPDIKYFDNKKAEKFSLTQDYVDHMKEALKEMQRQRGDLQINSEGIAQKGLLIRHLVLPNDMASSKEVLDFIKAEISENAFVNVMAQYHPAYKAYEYPELKYRLYSDSYLKVVKYARKIGLKRGLGC